MDGHLHIDVAAHAEAELRRAGLVGGAVDDDPAVGAQRVAMAAEQGGEMGRSRFLLALEDDAEVERRPPAFGAQRVDRGEDRHHAGFVVGGAAGVDRVARGALADEARR